jgi:hypothetical protein
MTDLIGGRTQFMLDAVSSALPYIKDNRVRALALTSKETLPALPGVPTLDATVMPSFVAPTWHGIFLPAHAHRQRGAALERRAGGSHARPRAGEPVHPDGRGVEGSTPTAFRPTSRPRSGAGNRPPAPPVSNVNSTAPASTNKKERGDNPWLS